jgi:hypothetical protein
MIQKYTHTFVLLSTCGTYICRVVEVKYAVKTMY